MATVIGSLSAGSIKIPVASGKPVSEQSHAGSAIGSTGNSVGSTGFANYDGLRSSRKSFASKSSQLAIIQKSRRRLMKAGVVVAKSDDKVELTIKVPFQVNYGERLAVSGSSKWFGKWKSPQEMTWTEEGWQLQVKVKQGEEAEYKFLILGTDGGGGTAWENGPNRKIQVPTEGSAFLAVANWDQTEEELSWQASDGIPDFKSGSADTSASEYQKPKTEVEGTSFSAQWQGGETSFMRSNDHSRNRRGGWNTEGLQGVPLRLVEGDRHAGNWWRKLEVVRNLLGDAAKDQFLEGLVYSAIYLQWINTGQVACVEDGGHNRPNKHALIARQIFRKLEQGIAAPDVTPKEALVIRKIHPRLPAFTAEFTASVPLTRIRDIAHRNDIPHDLKQEIKHTIQNKLHRNAGPEDLIATEALLKRVSQQPGQYSESFVEQLSIFYGELKDFFNAASLTEQLEAIRPSLAEASAGALDTFLAAKKAADAAPAASENGHGSATESGALIAALHALTGLRAVILKGLESGLRNDASDESIAMRQKWRLSEIGLEDYSFVLLSRFVNAVEQSGGAAALASDATAGSADRWSHSLGATVLGLRQLGLSGWQQPECAAIENELHAWQEAGLPKGATGEQKKAWALRLKATLDRARRLAEIYTETLLDLYQSSSQTLGKALAIPDNTVRTYAEAEIRASVVFQLAKLCSLLLKAVRQVAGGEGWDAIMPGTAIGTVVQVDRIVPGAITSGVKDEAVVLLVKEADGDEEVRAAGPNVAGVILCHELPHLSHLGVRARQEGVVFVTCEDEDRISDVKALAGRAIRLEASSESVRFSAYNGPVPTAKELVTAGRGASHSNAIPGARGGGTAGVASSSVQRAKVVSSEAGAVLQLADADVARAGAKAAACGQLARLAQAASGGASNGRESNNFLVPAGAAIPFGGMEEALKESGSFDQFKTLVAETETASVESGQLDSVCGELRALVARQRLSDQALAKLKESFPWNARLIVRSSANVEDLAGMSGAGLYESIPNVKLSEPDDFCKAVAEVWASLYTRRAVLSRRLAGVAQEEAAMAVLVQELLAPEVSFVLHTRSPIDGDEGVVQAELALGLGETLASGTRGSPWRLAVRKADGAVQTLAFANFNEALVVGSEGRADGKMTRKAVDYSKEALTVKDAVREQLGRQLASVGQYLEKELGCAQDIEGCVVGSDVYIVQARPQP